MCKNLPSRDRTSELIALIFAGRESDQSEEPFDPATFVELMHEIRPRVAEAQTEEDEAQIEEDEVQIEEDEAQIEEDEEQIEGDEEMEIWFGGFPGTTENPVDLTVVWD